MQNVHTLTGIIRRVELSSPFVILAVSLIPATEQHRQLYKNASQIYRLFRISRATLFTLFSITKCPQHGVTNSISLCYQFYKSINFWIIGLATNLSNCSKSWTATWHWYFSFSVSKDPPFDKYHDHPSRYSHTQDNGQNSSNDDPHRHLGRGIHLLLPC